VDIVFVDGHLEIETPAALADWHPMHGLARQAVLGR
jgi:hypothetical protein